jgi:hypothetical protein
MKIGMLNIIIIYFTHKTNSMHFNYYMGNVLIVRVDSVHDVGTDLASKLNVHHHIVYVSALSCIMVAGIKLFHQIIHLL